MSTPAYQYGVVLGQLDAAAKRMFQEIGAGLAGARTRQRYGLSGPLTDDQAEALQVVLYRDRIARERVKGLAFVRAEARRVRRELGLTDPGVRR